MLDFNLKDDTYGALAEMCDLPLLTTFPEHIKCLSPYVTSMHYP
jgi:hypothetical protein